MPYDANADKDMTLTTHLPEISFLLASEPQDPNPFNDPDYYKQALGLPIPLAKQLHTNLMGLLKPTEGDEKKSSDYFQILVRSYWLYVGEISKDLGNANFPLLALIRFGVLSPKIITPDQRNLLSRIHWDNTTGTSFHYADEWIKMVGEGKIQPLATDEPMNRKGTEVTESELSQKLTKINGQIDATQRIIEDKQLNRAQIEAGLGKVIEELSHHDPHSDFFALESVYSDEQKRLFGQITSDVKKLLNLNREISLLFSDLKRQSREVDFTQDRYKISSSGGADTFAGQRAQKEVESLAQLSRQVAGRRGNPLPVLLHNYFPYNENLLGTRERAIECVAEMEKLDPELFHRSYKGNMSRIVPHFILLPSYGEFGVCWEPFERGNKATGKGRIALPIFGRDINLAVIRGLADYRWEMAKEVASFRWMEEGLTGWFYEWFDKNIKKGNIKQAFVEQYILWITKESKGIQKLPKELRDIFWRYTPFSVELKNELGEKSFVYKELLQKDANRQSSQGY